MGVRGVGLVALARVVAGADSLADVEVAVGVFRIGVVLVGVWFLP
ncbi:two-component sensor histidine kinase, partial [Pseudomonas syringae pv. tagetis]